MSKSNIISGTVEEFELLFKDKLVKASKYDKRLQEHLLVTLYRKQRFLTKHLFSCSINLISATIGIPLLNESGMLVAVTANYVFDVLTGIVGFIVDYFRNSASKTSSTNYLNMFLSRKYVR